MGNFHATTIFAVHHNGECAMAGGPRQWEMLL